MYLAHDEAGANFDDGNDLHVVLGYISNKGEEYFSVGGGGDSAILPLGVGNVGCERR